MQDVLIKQNQESNSESQEIEALEKADITQYSSPDVEVVSSSTDQYSIPLDTLVMIDTSQMRTHRLPEDDEGMTSENQKRVSLEETKKLNDIINGVTPENSQGVQQLVHVRLPNNLVDKLTKYGLTVNMGHQTLIKDILIKFAESHNL